MDFWHTSVASILFILTLMYLSNKKKIENTAKLALWKIDAKIRVFLFVFYLLSPPLLVLQLFVYFVGLGFRKCLGVYLRSKHGTKFGGFLKNVDPMWAKDRPSKGYMLKYLIVKSDDEFGDFFEKVRKRVQDRCFGGKNLKLEATWHKFLGYVYILNNDCAVDDCLTLFECKEEKIDDKIVQRVMSDISDLPLSKNHTTFWKIYVLNKPFRWSKNDDEPKYAIILKVHHVTCDGIGMQKIQLGSFSDIEKHHKDVMVETEIVTPSFWATLKKYYNYLGFILAFNTTSYLGLFRKISEDLKNAKISGRKFCVCSREEKPGRFYKIRDIRKNLNASFSDVIFWAASTSFSRNFYKNKSTSDFIGYAMTSLPYLEKFPEQNYDKNDMDVLNNDLISMSFFLLPAKIEGESHVDTFRAVKKKLDLLRNSYNQEFGFWLCRIVGACFPINFYDLILWNLREVIVTNLVGDRLVTYFDGCQLVETVSYAPNYFTNGYTFTVTANENRLQVGFVVDRALVADMDEARKYTDGIFQQIDQLHEEITKKSTTRKNK